MPKGTYKRPAVSLNGTIWRARADQKKNMGPGRPMVTRHRLPLRWGPYSNVGTWSDWTG